MRYESNRKDFDRQLGKAINAVAYEGARHAASQMRRRASRDQAMKSAIRIKKSRFKNGGYIVGVFDTGGGKWPDSLAARAIYQSYGHAKPYQGRGGGVKRKNIVKHVPGNRFIPLSLAATRRALPRMIKGALK